MGNYIASCEKKLDEIECFERISPRKNKIEFIIIKTKPYEDQKTGPCGFRKKTKIFMQNNYLHNFIQSLFNIFEEETLKKDCLLIASDGRYFSDKAIQIICEIAAGNGINHIAIPRNGLATASACNAIIKKKILEKDSEQGRKKYFASIILTAYHDAGKENEVFGVKINKCDNKLTEKEIIEKINRETSKINSIKMKKIKKIKLNKIGIEKIDNLTIEIVKPVEDWLNIMKSIFDFNLIKKLTDNKQFVLAFDGFHGVTGEYAKELFVKDMKLNDKFFFNLDNKSDFNKLLLDPNLVSAKKMVDIMKINLKKEEEDNKDEGEKGEEKKDGKKKDEVINNEKEKENTDEKIPDLAGVCSYDGTRCMILGKRFFVHPCDNLAIISHYAEKCIPFFKNNLNGIAKTFTTSKAVNKVVEKLNKNLYETPPGYIYISNLVDHNKISLFGNESYGMGCSLTKENDGLFSILCWLSILAYKNNTEENKNNKFISVEDIVHEFWKEYGRFYCIRYDFENIEVDKCEKLFEFLNKIVKGELPLYEAVKGLNANNPKHRVKKVENFAYIDHVSKDISKDEGITIILEDESLIIFRKSKTAVEKATIRIFFEKYEKENIFSTNNKILKNIIYIGLKICKIKDFIGTETPTVVL